MNKRVRVIAFAILAYFVFKRTNMNFLGKYIPHVKKWEGGLSDKLSDSEWKHASPWVNPKTGRKYHTNKGITYRTFVSAADSLGYAVTRDNFINMPDKLWLDIMMKKYVGAYPLEEINHLPRIQAVIVSWAWGSGAGGSEVFLANFQREVMGIKDSNITKFEIVQNFKKHINGLNERTYFEALCKRRLEDFKKMSTWKYNGKGWENRLNDFYKTFA